jgi:hypothetical protein
MSEPTEWANPPTSLSDERRVYLQHLRSVHDDEGFRLARNNELSPPAAEVREFLVECEMLANYGVA